MLRELGLMGGKESEVLLVVGVNEKGEVLIRTPGNSALLIQEINNPRPFRFNKIYENKLDQSK